MQDIGTAAIYHPKNPQQSPLWKMLNDHYHDFELNYDESCACRYGYPRRVVSSVVYDYLKCGDLREGFARIRCPDCRHEHLQLRQTEHPGKPPPESLYKDMVDYLPFDDGWGDYEEPSITLN